ncbi:hypothetical protein T492DRAFT_885007 [Pavlovales sp. CCMP2436]|nr:hypothetical protein T492DRAFT_885007 [Pavlovales sp. CCMP2436]
MQGVRLFAVTMDQAGPESVALADLQLVAEGELSVGTNVRALLRVQTSQLEHPGSTVSASQLELTRGATISVSGVQWTIPADGRVFALVFPASSDTRAQHLFLACEFVIGFEGSDQRRSSLAAAIEGGGKLAAQGLLGGARLLGDVIGFVGRTVVRANAPAAADEPVSSDTKRTVALAQSVGDASLVASNTVLSTTTFAIKTVGRVTVEQARATTIYQRVSAEPRAGSAQRGAAARDTLDSADNTATALLHVALLVDSPAALALEVALESADHVLSYAQWLSGPLLRRGELKRRSGLTLLWVDGYLVALLREKALAFYETDRDDGDGRPCAVVAVEDMARVREAGEPGEHEFELKTRDNVQHRLRARSAAERGEWIVELGARIASADRTILLEGRPKGAQPNGLAAAANS